MASEFREGFGDVPGAETSRERIRAESQNGGMRSIGKVVGWDREYLNIIEHLLSSAVEITSNTKNELMQNSAEAAGGRTEPCI